MALVFFSVLFTLCFVSMTHTKSSLFYWGNFAIIVTQCTKNSKLVHLPPWCAWNASLRVRVTLFLSWFLRLFLGFISKINILCSNWSIQPHHQLTPAYYMTSFGKSFLISRKAIKLSSSSFIFALTLLYLLAIILKLSQLNLRCLVTRWEFLRFSWLKKVTIRKETVLFDFFFQQQWI